MTELLGGQIGVGDFIFAHKKGCYLLYRTLYRLLKFTKLKFIIIKTNRIYDNKDDI